MFRFVLCRSLSRSVPGSRSAHPVPEVLLGSMDTPTDVNPRRRGRRSLVLLTLFVVAGCAQARPVPLDTRAFAARIPQTPAERAPQSVPTWKGSTTITLAQVLAAANEANPEIAAERREIDIATAAIWEARLYPNPSLLLEVEDYPLGARGAATRRVGVRVPIVIGDRLRAGSRAAELEREVAALRFLWRRREILLGVRKAYIDLIAARRSRDASRESRDVAKSLLDTAEARLAAQAAPEGEVLKSRVELSRADGELESAEILVGAAGRTLEATMGPAGVSADRVVGDLARGFVIPPFNDLLQEVAGRSALEEIARAEQRAAQSQIAAAQAERTPDIELEAKAGESADGQGVVSLGVGIPLPFNNRNEAKIASAQARSFQAAARVDAARQEVVRRLVSAHRVLASAQAKVTRLSTEATPTAEKSLELVRLGFEKGKLAYLDVIDARRTLSETKAALAAALAELNTAAAELEALTGVELSPLVPK